MAKQSARNQLMQALKEPGVCDYSTSEEMIKAHELFKLMRENNEKDRNIDALIEGNKKPRRTRSDAGKKKGGLTADSAAGRTAISEQIIANPKTAD